MIELKTVEEIQILRTCNVHVMEILQALKARVAPGMTTWDLEQETIRLLRERGVTAAFKGLYGFPCHICISVNEEVVHGIPSPTTLLRAGDIVGLDFGVTVKGFYGDAAITVPVGPVTPDAERLLRVTEEALYLGIAEARPGNRVGDISHAIQRHVEARGMNVVRQYVGHGIGRLPHEPPQVPNFGTPGTGPLLEEGMVLALEPMVTLGHWEVEVLGDHWTVVTKDRSLSAHFEHSVAIAAEGPIILSKL